MQLSWHVQVRRQDTIVVMQWNTSEGQRSVLSLAHFVQQHEHGED